MPINWELVDLEPLRAELRGTLPGPEAERMIYAFEEAIRVARVDPDLLDCLLAATVCLRAVADDATPRHVLEDFFRRYCCDGVPREDAVARIAASYREWVRSLRDVEVRGGGAEPGDTSRSRGPQPPRRISIGSLRS